MKKHYELISSYQLNSVFELDFDIREKFDWYIQWDSLFIKDDENSEWREIEPNFPFYLNTDSHKSPHEIDLYIHDKKNVEHHSL